MDTDASEATLEKSKPTKVVSVHHHHHLILKKKSTKQSLPAVLPTAESENTITNHSHQAAYAQSKKRMQAMKQ